MHLSQVGVSAAELEVAKNLAKELGTTAHIFKKKGVEDAKKVVEFAEAVKGLATQKAGDLLKATMEVKRKSGSEATRGNNSTLNISDDNAIDLESTSFSPSSDSTDNVPLNRVYKTLDKALAPSPSTKTSKKLDDVFVPMYPSILERIGNMSQMRIDVCQKLPADHPFQPPFIQPLQTIPSDEQFGGEQAEPAYDNPKTTSSQPQSSNQTRECNTLFSYLIIFG